MRNIEIESFLKMKYVSNPLFSSDVNLAAFIVKTPNIANDNYLSELYTINTFTNYIKKATSFTDIVTYCWINEKELLFLRKRNEKNKGIRTEFYKTIDDSDKVEHVFTIDMEVLKLSKIDNNNFYILAYSKDENNNNKLCVKANYDVFNEVPFWSNGYGISDRVRTSLYKYSCLDNKLTRITSPMFRVENYYAVGSNALIIGVEFENVASTKNALLLFDACSNKLTEIIPQDTKMVKSACMIEDNIIVMISEDLDHFAQPHLIDKKTKDLKKIATIDYFIGDNGLIADCLMGSGQSIKTDENKMYFITTINEKSVIKSIDINGNISNELTKQNLCDSFDVINGHILTCSMDNQKLNELYLDNKQITYLNESYNKSYYISVPEYHKFVAADGFEIHGYVMKPIDYQYGVKYPAILHIHGGPQAAFSYIYNHEMQVWANAGYYVLFCNPRGSDGRGYSFANIKGLYGKVDYDNIMEFTDKMLECYPDIDENKLAVTGGSYGGFMTNWIIGHTNKFAVAVSQRSISSWINKELTTDIGYYFVMNQQDACTAENPEKLWWHSPLKYANKCKTPTLFIQSDQDYRCWLQGCLAMFSAIKLAGTEAKVCLFHGENHELSRSGKPKNRIARMQEIVTWINTHLKAD